MRLSRSRTTVRGMMAAIGLFALTFASAIHLFRPGSSTFTVVNRSGRTVSQMMIVVTAIDGAPILGGTSPIVGETFAFQNLTDGSTAKATSLSRGVGSRLRTARPDAFLL